jgi:hypothetical protein
VYFKSRLAQTKFGEAEQCSVGLDNVRQELSSRVIQVELEFARICIFTSSFTPLLIVRCT